MHKSNLMLHYGANKVEREQLAIVPTPTRTNTWVPLAHDKLLSGVMDSITANHMTVVSEAHGLTRDGARYFCLLQVANGHNADNFGLVIGLRNSHDKSFPAGLVIGASVFICDNLSFSGEVKLARKHTVHVERDLPQLIAKAVGQLTELRHTQDARFSAYKQTELTDTQAHDFLVRAVDARVIPVTYLPDVLKEWRQPRHEEFRQGLTMWRLFNGFTEALKGNLDLLAKRTQALHGLLDGSCGLLLPTAERKEIHLVQPPDRQPTDTEPANCGRFLSHTITHKDTHMETAVIVFVAIGFITTCLAVGYWIGVAVIRAYQLLRPE